MWSRIRPRCATLLGKSIAVAFSNSRSPREYEFATDRSSYIASELAEWLDEQDMEHVRGAHRPELEGPLTNS